MTTWCESHRQDSSSSSRSPSSSSSAAAVSGKGRLAGKSERHKLRHSIADILGWRVVDTTSSVMASDCVDVVDMVMGSDEPLDLSLDKSKCRRERERDSRAISPILKRARTEEAISDGADEAEEEGLPDWGHHNSVQPHLQMAANFSTVLQYYLTAARLWQTGADMRCQESQQRADDSSEAGNDVGDDGHGSDGGPATAKSVVHESQQIISAHQQQPSGKRRKKDVDPPPGDSATNGGARPRKTRTTFTGKQLFELERIFEQKKYLSSNERQEVARLLNVTGSQIKIWFQNRRTKWKKQDPSTAAELAQLKSASRASQQQQQQCAPAGSSGKSNKTGSSSADPGSAAAPDDINSDASSPPAPSPSPV